MATTRVDTTAAQNAEQALATLNAEGKAPLTRLADAYRAWEVYKKMRDADMPRSEKRAGMQGLVDGNPPWTEGDQTRVGQGWRSNMNPREAEAIREGRKAAYHALIEKADAYIDIGIKPAVLKDYPQYQDESSKDFGEIIAEEHQRLMKRWPDFLFEMFQHQEQMIMWAAGNCYFPDEWDWRFKSARVGQLLIPDGSQCKLSDFELIAIRSSYRVHELYDRIRTPAKRAASKEAGWDTDLIQRILQEAVSMQMATDRYQVGDWESWQQRYQNAEFYWDYSVAPSIQNIHLLYKEFDGKITHSIICENETYNKIGDPERAKEELGAKHKGQDGGFLFRKLGRYESWQNCLCLFFSNFGNGTYHSLRGLAAKIYAICWENMKLLNGTLDAAKLLNTVMLQPNNQAHKTAMAISKYGAWAIVESGFNMIQQTAFRPDLTGAIGVKNLMDGILDRNIGMVRPNISETDPTGRDAQTIQAIKGHLYKEAKLEDQEVCLYYFQLTALWNEQLRRLLNSKLRKEDPGGEEAFEFRESCKARGVPEEWLKYENLEVEARSVIGPTSPMLRSLILGENLSRSAYFDERGKRNALRDATTALVGARHADRYVVKSSRNDIPSQEKSFASMENAILQTGAQVIVGADQNHVEHNMVHFAPLLAAVQMFQQQGGKIDAVKAAQMFRMLLSHLAGHLDYLKGDPAHVKEFKDQYATFTELENVFKLLEKKSQAIQKQQQDAAQAHAEAVQEALSRSTDPKAAALMEKVRMDAAIKADKAEKDAALKEYRTNAEQARKDMMTEHNIEMQDKMTQAQIEAMRRRTNV